MQDGTGYRLPTEAEWEFACRAGTTTKYWIGDTDEDLRQAGWFSANTGQRTHAVGELKANPFGVYDIHGNVWEWVQDWRGGYQAGTTSDPTGPGVASLRVLRGGCWIFYGGNCRSAFRNRREPALRARNVGFRVAGVGSGS